MERSHVDKPFGSVAGMGHASSGDKDVMLLLRSSKILATVLQAGPDFPGISNTQNKHKNSFKMHETSTREHEQDFGLYLIQKASLPAT